LVMESVCTLPLNEPSFCLITLPIVAIERPHVALHLMYSLGNRVYASTEQNPPLSHGLSPSHTRQVQLALLGRCPSCLDQKEQLHPLWMPISFSLFRSENVDEQMCRWGTIFYKYVRNVLALKGLDGSPSIMRRT